MDVIGTKRSLGGNAALLKSLAVEGRPQEFPGKPGLAVVFGYDKTFEENRTEEALVHCESLEDMQGCYDRLNGKTRTVWYTAEVPKEPHFELVPVENDELDIEEDFEGLL